MTSGSFCLAVKVRQALQGAVRLAHPVEALLSGQIEALAGVLLLVLAGTEALHGQDLVVGRNLAHP
ncbi:hypothetical protein [Acidithiobacillus thiooxidans]|uniref:hypothetical protein n=1 Tax=Acidithiobacillus thiooxidans TaxID=930 RepID=UPI0035646EC8